MLISVKYEINIKTLKTLISEPRVYNELKTYTPSNSIKLSSMILTLNK